MNTKTCHLWLWASDILDFRDPDQYVPRVSIVGTVVRVIRPYNLEEGNKPVGYYIDDGTGTVKVVHFLQKRLQRMQDDLLLAKMAKVKSDGGPTAVLKHIESLHNRTKEPLEVGMCVEVKGRVQFFRGNTEIVAYEVREISDPNLELARFFEMEKLRPRYREEFKFLK
ncbi:uncharacterized protein LOC131884786 [Tigriopus californicus]|uniref:uncharacterized protein LOC131884786 n=1 Tax=Tigriopus californicus TaxID=6832 RepID=UPI0027DAA399|nr:uncharacterized protein LOC131884786 [Tigriopus californicus]